MRRERERDVSPLESSLLSTSRTRSPSRLLILTPDHQRWPLVAGTSINAFTVVLCTDVIQMGFVFAKRFVVLVLFASITLTPPSTPSSNPLQGRTEMGCRRFNVAVARSDWCERDCLATRRMSIGITLGLYIIVSYFTNTIRIQPYGETSRGAITWGHAVSTDLIHWLYLPIAMDDGQIIMLYTGDTNDSVQVQNLAYPANLSDPLLLDWVKYSNNPVLVPPPGIAIDKFRDPTTGWLGPDGKWRITIGSKVTGMWECVDFYPVSINGSTGLDTSVTGPGIKHVLKASLDDTKLDYYAIGTYFSENDTWVPDNPTEDVGIGLRLDYGRYYASKTFYDPKKERRILWGWINETDTEDDDLAKGWASVQTIPRTVLFDNKTGTNVVQWPVEEVETLRLNSTEFDSVLVEPGSVVELNIGTATQLDIFAEFEIESLGLEETNEEANGGCGDGAIHRSSLGPFGLLVIADETLSELTPIYFRPSNSSDGTYFCADEKRSTEANEIYKQIYGSKVPVLDGEKYSMRVLVDHSIVESFAQGGRTVITSRVYPTEAIYGSARLFLFNNATGVNVKATLKIWQLNSAFIHPFPLDQIDTVKSMQPF
uniref:Beta-fructofuranosidase n=1 Tax=Fagus sylvatica TaxID=28930 RepID=A0A2N9HZ43_FAGSY